MPRLFQVIGAGLLALVMLQTTVHTAQAEQPIPSARFVATQDVDFYGADLDALFDTDLSSCVRACSALSSCVAFTFNARSGACFPKSSVQDRVPYAGAVSAQKIDTPQSVIERGQTQVAALDFLSERDLEGAFLQARDIGLLHRTNGEDVATLIETARQALGAQSKAQWYGAAISLLDHTALWTEYASQLLKIETKDRGQRRDFRVRARGAAINAFLRAETGAEQSSALTVLARALEDSGRGRDSIPALRLAYQLQPRKETETALDRAIAQYGFRVLDSFVESDSANPRICVAFSEPLVKAGVDYEPFVSPATGGVEVEGDQLCLGGFDHGKRYRMVIRSGLPAQSGETLIKDVELTHYVRDRSPAVRFIGRTYVLPKSADAALPVQTVNLDTLDLQLRRVSDRNLLRSMQDGYFGRPLSNWEDRQFSTDIAEEIWTGTAEVPQQLNTEMLTRLPLGEVLSSQPAGIYALTARIPGADPHDTAGATQWFVLTDLGLVTQLGSNGLQVTVQGLSDAQPRAGVAVSLISRANAVLATAQTDATGLAGFDAALTRGRGAAAPALVLAEADDDLVFLSLTDPAFDLSDRGVEGRAPAGPVDVFLTTDRGAYRAGEVINVTALTRDSGALAVNVPLIAVLKRPDGVEYSRQISDAAMAGGHVFAFPVGRSAPRGTWNLDVFTDPKAPALASQSVLVEDFLPERIDFDLALPQAPIRQGDMPPLSIDARYLFGAPGVDLDIEGSARLSAVDTLADWPGYRFGRHDDLPRPKSTRFDGSSTDAQGRAQIPVEIPTNPEVQGQPLELLVTARLSDGSARPVERSVTAPVQPSGPVIGIKPLFDDLGEGQEAAFDLISLGPDLAGAQMQAKWTLNRVQTRYQWYQLNGSWEWEPITRRTRIAEGTVTLGADAVSVTAPVDWGAYELIVERTDGTYTASSVGFEAGWYAAPGASAPTPDKLELSLDRERYAPGDVAQLRIVPRFAGTAMVSVLSDRIITRQIVDVSEGENLIPLEITEDWGAGAYVTATVLRPMDVAAGRNPARALGLAHASVDTPGQRLQVHIDSPDLARPRGVQTVRVTVDSPDEAWVTLAAVDEGILNLTGFQAPDPQGYYFGQRRLGVELRDLYGRLIDGMNGAMGQVRSGGDAGAGLRMQSPPPTQELMAVFSGPMRVENGSVEVPIDLPDFNGNVRLMAVAWSAGAVGQAATDMLVRDPVVVAATLPRFLAPGDTARMLLDITHADGPDGEMALAVTANGVALGDVPASVTLTKGARQSVSIPVSAAQVGDAKISVTLTTPDGTILQQDLTLPIRANDPVIAQTQRFALAAGEDFVFDPSRFAGLVPGSAQAILSAGPFARLDVPGLLTTLDRYPYGCTEQVTSQTLPLLYLSSLAQAAGLGDQAAMTDKINAGIQRVLTRQSSNGAFGLWSAGSGDFWLDAYVTDFLSRARAEGYSVPQTAFDQALDNLRNRINYAPDFDSGGEDIAYALMVLAREGDAAISDLRYYADVKGDAFKTPLAAAQVGAALASYGDQLRADQMFGRAAALIDSAPAEESVWRTDYGTQLRDRAGVLALATQARSDVIPASVLTGAVAQGPLSTQEAAWSLIAAHSLIQDPDRAGLLVDGVAPDGPFVKVIEDAQAAPITLSAAGTGPVDVTLTLLGVPESPPPAGGTGYSLTRRYFTIDGKPADLTQIKAGDRFVAVLEVQPFEEGGARLMVNDPLPAGFEIDNPNLLQSGDIDALDWVSLSGAEHTEFRSDRFLAAVDVRGTSPVTLAYVVRAVTPGQFHHPAASVEDMYRPRNRARTQTGRIDIRPLRP